jgi:cytochrome d ubiquinol oxidase subunit II
MTALQAVWFLLIGVLLAGYAVLDGMDLGAAFWHLFAKKERDRRLIINAVGPVWDGNEVWLLTGGGALFAAFPPVYAAVFSGMYPALMLLLLSLICRAVAVEFRGKVDSARWKAVWDFCFALGSAVAALLLGVALGNMMRGIPLDPAGYYTGTFFDLLNPFSIAVGLTGLAMFAVHGAVFIALKADGELSARASGWARKASVAYIALYVAASAWSLASNAHLRGNYYQYPFLWIFPMGALASMARTPMLLGKGRVRDALLSSSASILFNFATIGAGLFPRLVPAINDLNMSLTAANASSSEKTLGVMLAVALIGMPLVIVYTVFAYRTFKGKTNPDD